MPLHNVRRAEAGGGPIAGYLGTCRQGRTNSSHLFMSQELKDRARHRENTQGESLWCKISLLLPQRHTVLSCPRGLASSPAWLICRRDSYKAFLHLQVWPPA